MAQFINRQLEQSYIENILRLNKGKIATVYMNFENSTFGSKIFKGYIESATRDHFILSDLVTGKRYILLSAYIDFIIFDGEITYRFPNAKKAFRVEPPSVSAQSAILLDGNTSSITFERNAFTPLPIASLTKIMTAVVALEAADLDDKVTISQEAEDQEPSACPLQAGDVLTLRDLLYCLLLRSGNDAAWAIAEYVAGNMLMKKHGLI